MNVAKRKCATLIAAIAMNLSLFGICADASHAAPLAAGQIVSNTHARTHARIVARIVKKRTHEHALSYAPLKLHVIATAYIADCEDCSGTTSTGMRAGRGIVAVDPHVIALGTKLYIPGYGNALAGDTGGDIRGRRVDLGFDSLREAERFGRQEIVVYVLRTQKRSANR